MPVNAAPNAEINEPPNRNTLLRVIVVSTFFAEVRDAGLALCGLRIETVLHNASYAARRP